MTDIEMLLKELEKIKADQLVLMAREMDNKAELKTLLDDLGLEDYKSEGYGSIRKQQRVQKNYGKEIEAMEAKLKASKKLADDLGDYEIEGYKESLVYTPPKDIL